MRASYCAAACLVAGVLAETACGAEPGFYFGASIGESDTSIESGAASLYDGTDSGYKIHGGWRLRDWLAVEVSYVDLGSIKLQQNLPDVSSFEIEQVGYDVSGVLLWPIGSFDLFAKAGLIRSESDHVTSTPTGVVESDDDDTDFSWGVGAQWWLGRFGARVEYQRFAISNGEAFDRPELLAIGFSWTF
jgi:hypothetical protein